MKKITKKELNSNIHLSEGNIKSKGSNKIMFLTWSLPSQITCPYSTELCRKRCFAKKNENFEGVRNSRRRNLEETYKDTFVDDMIKHFEYHLQRPKALNKLVIVRIHTSGDFYDNNYFCKWVKISNHFKGNKNIIFQAYTKSMPIFMERYDYLESMCDMDRDEYADELRESVNIHFVWSVWDDTPEEYTEFAELLELQTFTAMSKQDIDKIDDKYTFICNNSDCASCLVCYSDKYKKIVIPYH